MERARLTCPHHSAPAGPDVGDPRIPLSIVIPTIRGWPDIEPCLRSVSRAAERVAAEMIVADASGREAPDGTEMPGVRWISQSPASVYQLRLLGYRAAKGEILAGTEDHCVVAPDWAAEILRAHAERPDAAVIGGSVDNGATDDLVDWASYFAVQTDLMPPLRHGDARHGVLQGNVSYKRRVIDDFEDRIGLGLADSLFQSELMDHAETVIVDTRMRVWHDQSLGFGGSTRMHFHAGRAGAAFRRARMGSKDLLRIAAAPGVPWIRAARIWRTGLAKRTHWRQLIASAPLMVLLLYCEEAGRLVGYVAGPGASPQRTSG